MNVAITLAEMRDKWRNLQVVIVDEVSMLSPERILHLHQRLSELIGCNYNLTGTFLFGKRIVIFVGDLYQLPPVMTKPIYRQLLQDPANMFNLWDNFLLCVIT